MSCTIAEIYSFKNYGKDTLRIGVPVLNLHELSPSSWLSLSHHTAHSLTHTHTHTHTHTPLTRVEGECIDYSTQYPWSFGVLSVLMATGLHPLKDYPETYEGGNKVKYRSHDYQALPDTEQVRTSVTFGD
jgi:hypothetical protein